MSPGLGGHSSRRCTARHVTHSLIPARSLSAACSDVDTAHCNHESYQTDVAMYELFQCNVASKALSVSAQQDVSHHVIRVNGRLAELRAIVECLSNGR